MMWCPFVYDLGHTLSVTTQDTRYVSHRYWPHRVSQSSKHMSVHFLIKYLWIRSWEHSYNLWGYTLSLLGSVQGQCLTCPIQYTPSVLAEQVGARSLLESRQTLKCYATTLPMVCHFHHRLWTNYLTYQGTGDQVLCVLTKLNNTRSPTMNKLDTSHIWE